MEEQIEKLKVTGVAKKWGMILALASIIYFIILSMAGLAGEQAYGWLGSIITIVIIVLAHKEFKEGGDGFMSFGEGFKIGALISVISSVISSLFTFVYVKFVDGSMLDMARDKAIMDMEERGMSEAEIDQAMEFAQVFMSPVAITIMGMLGGIIVGIILSLIISAITKNANPAEEM